MKVSLTRLLCLALFTLTACNSPDQHVCEKGETQRCLCTATTWGSQNCRSDLIGWDECQCETPTPKRSDPLVVPETYTFISRFEPVSSVGYPGQTVRHVFLHDLLAFVEGLTEQIDAGSTLPSEVNDWFEFYFAFDEKLYGDEAHALVSELPIVQKTYGDISPNKNLIAKLAGNDPVGQHVDWKSLGIMGWTTPEVVTPESFVNMCFSAIEARANDHATNGATLGTDQVPLPVYVSTSGMDYHALLETFLHGAIAFSQAADDYLDVDMDGKGINGDNTKRRHDGPFTDLEHFWDEGFGYFGAARDFNDHILEKVAAGQPKDSNGDGAIDLLSESNFGAVVMAATLDINGVESSQRAKTAFNIFLRGRAIISHAAGPLSSEARSELIALRDTAINHWESTLAGAAVASLNRVLQQMNAPVEAYSFLMHAKAWSQLKGLTMSLQFNPRSVMSKTALKSIHEKIGQAPVLPGSPEVNAYLDKLREVKALLGEQYKLSKVNLGDDQGLDGWGHP